MPQLKDFDRRAFDIGYLLSFYYHYCPQSVGCDPACSVSTGIGFSPSFPEQIEVHIFDQNLFLKADCIEYLAQVCKIAQISFRLGRQPNTTALVCHLAQHFVIYKASWSSYSGQLLFDCLMHSISRGEVSLAHLSPGLIWNRSYSNQTLNLSFCVLLEVKTTCFICYFLARKYLEMCELPRLASAHWIPSWCSGNYWKEATFICLFTVKCCLSFPKLSAYQFFAL